MSDRTAEDALEVSTRRWMRAGLVLMTLFVAAFPAYRLYEPASRAEALATQRGHLAAQGRELYETSCASCHGLAGTGGLGPAVGAKEFLAGLGDGQIAQLIALGMPGSEMVAYSIDYGGPLTSSQIDAITAYLRSLEEKDLANPLWRTPLADEDLDGRDLYVMACSRCHGAGLAGTVGVAPDIGPGSDASEETDTRLVRRIRDGGDEMPGFGGHLTEDQIQLVVAYLREAQGGG